MLPRCVIDFPREGLSRLSGQFAKPLAVIEAWRVEDVLPLLQQAEAQSRNGRWVVGMMSYEAATAFDPAMQAHTPCPDIPLASFAVFDAVKPFAAAELCDFSCSIWQNDTTRAAFEKNVRAIRNDIATGNYYQTNYTTRLSAEFSGDAEALFNSLCAAQPDGYSFFMDTGAWQIASVSPELFFAWEAKSGKLTTRPMKGTASLTLTADSLSTSGKDRAENLMIVDLLRNDISRIADQVQVPDLFTVQNLSTARQMTSTVTGVTRHAVGLADIFKALFPCGSVTGAPKIAAMQAIRQLETSPRGAYCGAFGIIEPGGNATFSVGIRSVTITGNKAMCGIGSGITWDSKSAGEYAENRIKQRFLWRATAGFDLLETLRLEEGQFWLLQRHLDRLRHSAAYFGFVYDETATRQALDKCATQNPHALCRVRLLFDRQGNVKIETFSFDDEIHHKTGLIPLPLAGGVRGGLENTNTTLSKACPDPAHHTNKSWRSALVALAAHPINSDNEFLHHKTTNRAVYASFTPTDPAIFDTLLHNQRNEITEFTRGNVVMELGGKFVTPPISCGLLPGTLRADMLAKGGIREQIITRDDMMQATRVFFINGLRGVIEVTF